MSINTKQPITKGQAIISGTQKRTAESIMKRFNLRLSKSFLAAIFAAALLTACSNENVTTEITTAAVNNYIKQSTDITVTGEVISIVGNEVTLALGELSEDTPEKPKQDPITDDAGKNLSVGERDMRSFGEGMPDGNEMPNFSGMTPPDGEGISDLGSDMHMNGSNKQSSASIEKNGSEAIYIIPVGMTIDGLNGRNSDYSGITAGSVLTLTINSDGLVCAAEVE